MALLISQTGNNTVLDETAGLQNFGQTPSSTGDADDNDTALTLPTEFSTRLTAVGETSLLDAALTGHDGTNSGLNAFTITDDGGGVDDLGLTQAGGVPFPTYDGGDPADGIDSGLEAVDGGTIYLFQDVTTNNIVYGVDTDGDIVLAVYLDEANDLLSGMLWSVQTEAIVHPDSPDDFDESVYLTNKLFVTASRDLEFSVENAPAGQSLHITFSTGESPLPAGNVAIIVTGETPPNTSDGESLSDTDRDSVNTRSGTSFGTNNQGVSPEESLWFTFVTGTTEGFTVPNLDQNEADVELTIQFTDFFGAVGARFVIEQVVSGKTAAIRLTAVDEEASAADASEDNFVDELLDGGAPVDIDRVVIEGTRKVNGPAPDNDFRIIITESGIVVDQGSDPGITANFNMDGSVEIFDVAQGDIVEYTTDGTAERINIANIGDGTGQDSGTIDIGSFQLIQGDTISVEIGSTVVFEDDGPVFELTLGSGVLETDDGALTGGNAGGTTTDTEGVGSLFTVTTELPGADGDGGTVYKLELGTNTTTTLKDTATGEAVVLSLNSGVVEGRTETSDDLVFTLSVNSSTGAVTQTQMRAVEHSTDETEPAYDDDTTGLGVTDAVLLTGTLTDGEIGDSDSDTIDISGNISFTDDGPVFELTLGSGVLETDDGALTGGNAGGTTTDTEGVGSLFTVTTELPGADGDGGTVYKLELGTNTTTTLKDTATGEAVVLSLNSGVVEGRTETSDDLVFTLSVNSSTGAVTQTQMRAVEHSTDETEPAYDDDTTGLGVTDAVLLTGTLTDGEIGDSDSDTIDISGNISFTDDGPVFELTLGSGVLETDDGALTGGNAGGTTTDTEGVGSLFTVTTELPGADGDGGTVYKLELGTNTTTTLKDTATGEAVVLSLNSGVVEGRTETSDDLVFTLSVNSSTGAVTQTQMRAVEHSTDETEPAYDDDTTGLGVTDAVLLTGTLTDGEIGDSDSDTIDISGNISFTDDGPVFELTLGSGVLETDDGALTGGNAGGTTTDTEGVGSLFTVTTELPGADGDGGTVYKLELGTNTTTTLKDTATGEAVVLSLNSGVVEGRTETSDDLVFTLSVNSSTGAVTQTQMRAVEHSTDETEPAYDDDTTGLGVTDAVLLTGTLTDGEIGDSDSDTIDISGNISFTDDGPVFELTLGSGVLETDDGALTGGNAGGTTTDTEGVGSLFTVTTELPGADGDGGTVYKLELGTNTTTTLKDTATGEAVVLSLNSGVVEGRTETSDDLVFTLSVNSSTGAVTQTQMRAVEHSTDETEPAYDDDTTGLGVTDAVLLTGTLTDGEIGDSDSDTIDISGNISFTDDGPVVTVDDLMGTFAPGVQGPGDWSDSPGADGFKSLNINLVSYTIDANSTVNIDDDLGTLTTPDVNGNFVFMGSITDDFTDDGMVNDQTVNFTLTFDDDGTYDFELTTPPSSVLEISSADGSLDAGGPDPVRTLTVDSTDIVFSAVDPTTSALAIVPFLDTGEANIEDFAGFLSTDEMNVSTAGIGNDNNNFDGNADSGVDGNTTMGGKTDESFVVDPDSDISSMKVFIDNSVSGYDTNTEELYYRVFYSDGSFDAMLTLVGDGDLTAEAGGQVSFVVGDSTGESNIDAVQLFMGTGTVKIPVIEFTITEEFDPEPLDMVFTATLVDNDDDSDTDSFLIDLDPGMV